MSSVAMKTQDLRDLGYVRYGSVDEIKVGDVIVQECNLKMPGYAAFVTCVVEKIEERPEGEQQYGRLVHLYRPHVQVTAADSQDRFGTAWVRAELFTVEDQAVVRSFVRFTTGHTGRPDNRFT